MKLKALGLVALILLILSPVMLSLSTASGGDLEGRARALVDVAVKAEARVNMIIKSIEENKTIMAAIISAGLEGSLNEIYSLKRDGSALLEEAKSSLASGEYAEAIQKAIEAMRLLREAFVGVHKVLCEAGLTPLGIEERPDMRAQGLLVAANRTLERIMWIRSLPYSSEVEDLLSQAESLLSEMENLLGQGNISAAAHKLAEANKLISEAIARLKRRAEEMFQKRAEKIIIDFGRIRREITSRIREEGLNETEVLGGLGLRGLDQIIQNLTETIGGIGKINKDRIKEIIESLKEINSILREVKEMLPEKPSIRAKIGEILINATAFNGKMVRIEGKYCGAKPPEGLQGPAGGPPKGDWWILADETGWIYLIGDGYIGLTRRLPILGGAGIIVIGKVIVEGSTLYIRAILVVPSEPVIAPIPSIGEIKPTTPEDILKLSVEVERAGRNYLVKVTVKNVGIETIIFPNSAYGITIERKVGAIWFPVYTPIAAQVLTRLKPGDNGTIIITLERPIMRLAPGTYRAVVVGWLDESGATITASIEFSIP